MKIPFLQKKEKRVDRKEMSLVTLTMLTTSVGLMVLAINILYFQGEQQLFTIINLAVAVISLGIPLLYRYSVYSRYKRIEDTFPRFLRDITEGVNTGMTVTQAIRAASR